MQDLPQILATCLPVARFLTVWHSVAQIHRHYGEPAAAELLALCQAKLFLGSITDGHTVTELTRLLGQRAIEQNQNPEILTAQALQRTTAGEGLLIHTHQPPTFYRQRRYYDDPVLRALASSSTETRRRGAAGGRRGGSDLRGRGPPASGARCCCNGCGLGLPHPVRVCGSADGDAHGRGPRAHPHTGRSIEDEHVEDRLHHRTVQSTWRASRTSSDAGSELTATFGLTMNDELTRGFVRELARSLPDVLDDETLAILAERLRPHLAPGMKPEAHGEPLLTAAQAAELTGVHVETIRRAVRAGNLLVAGRIGRSPRIRPLELDRWVAETSGAGAKIRRATRRRASRSRDPENTYSLKAAFRAATPDRS